MTPKTPHRTDRLQPDKIFDHHRQQLSAMMDGALAPDHARFLLRRLQHDTDLTACWERWQLCGDVLRGHADALLSRDFAQQVATAVAAEAAPVMPATAASRPRWARWGGGAALAASVAVAALLVLRQTPNANGEFGSDPARVIVAAPTTSSVPEPVDAPRPSTATAIAAAEVPRRNTRRSRGQGQRAAIRNAVRAVETRTVVANGTAPTTTTSATANAISADPFAIGSTAPARSWPRALLPNAPASGGFTVGLGSSIAAPSFYPFEPRVPVAGGNADDGASNADAGTEAVADEPPPR